MCMSLVPSSFHLDTLFLSCFFFVVVAHFSISLVCVCVCVWIAFVIIKNTKTMDVYIGLQAVMFKGQYELAIAQGNEVAVQSSLDGLKMLATKSISSSSSSSGIVSFIAAQVLFAAGQIKEALLFLHSTSSTTGSSGANAAVMLEMALLQVQIYIKIDRLDLAASTWNEQMRSKDEDSILTHLGSVYLHLATGRSTSADAVHTITMLSEQYGASPFLLNLVSCALIQQGDYAGARIKLQECLSEFGSASGSNDVDDTGKGIVPPETYANLLICAIHMDYATMADVTAMSTSATTVPSWFPILQQLQQNAPHHPMATGYTRVAAAFDREAIKYKV
jgi:hypothetical protein